ncbi:MAG TPA: cupin domain-containing protein [Thermoanaerobaculia bacterium]
MSRNRLLTLGIAALVLILAPASLAAGSGAKATMADDAALTWHPCPEFMPAGCGIAVLQGDPSKPNADIFFKVPANAEIPSHWHTSAERMVLVSGKMTVRYDGAEPVVLRPGMYAYGPAKAAHSASCGGEGPCVLFIAFESPVDAVAVETKAADEKAIEAKAKAD